MMVARKSLLQNVGKTDLKVSKPIEFFGAEEASAGFLTYYADYSNKVELDVHTNKDNNGFEYPYSFIQRDWYELNSFTFMIDKDTKEIVAIRDFGMYLPTSMDFIYSTKYIPFSIPNQPATPNELQKYGETALKIWEDENKKISEIDSHVLIILGHLGYNCYIAWSIDDKKHVYIYDYKAYKKEFGVSDIDCRKADDVIWEHSYVAYVPSELATKTLNLRIDYFLVNNKAVWDRWEARPEREEKELTFSNPKYERVYKTGIKVANYFRQNEHDEDELVFFLESELDRLEKMYGLHAPEQVIADEIGLIASRIEKLENLMI